MTPSTAAPTDPGALADEPSELLTNIRTASEIEQERLARKAVRRAAHARVADTDCEMAFIEACDEAGCAYDNKALLKAITDLKRNSAPQETRGDEPLWDRLMRAEAALFHGAAAGYWRDFPIPIEPLNRAPSQQSPRLEREGIAPTDEQIEVTVLRFARDRGCPDMRLTYDRGSYEITTATNEAKSFARAILALLSPDTAAVSSTSCGEVKE